MEVQTASRAADAERQPSKPRAQSISSDEWGLCIDKDASSNPHPVLPFRRYGGQRHGVIDSADPPDDTVDCCGGSLVGAPMDTGKMGKHDTDGTEDFSTMNSGCGSGVALHSFCASSSVREPSLLPATDPAVVCSVSSVPPTAASESPSAFTDDSRAVSAAHAAPTMCSSPLKTVKNGPGKLALNTLKASSDQRSFTSMAMQATVLRNTIAGPPLRSSCSRSDLSSSAGGASHVPSGDDPMGVRQLYSLPSSRAGSSLGMPAFTEREAARRSAEQAHSLAAVDAFSMERFATFYEAALEELVVECERRVANAPGALRDSQRQLIRGEKNGDLTTSTHSFNSPRSTVTSSPDGVASRGTASCIIPGYPLCSPGSLHNSHEVHRSKHSGDAGVHQRHASLPFPPPPPPSSLHSRTGFFKSTEPACQVEPEKSVAVEETVPALLAALGRHHGKMAPMVFIAGLAYLARITVLCASEFLSITRANWYRLTTTAILVAAKVYDEHSSSRLNARFARSSGIPLAEMTKLELDFLYLVDFDLLLKESEVEQWLTWMEVRALRRDLMTPLNSYVLGTSSSTTPGQVSSSSKPLFKSGFTAAEHWGHTKMSAMLEESCTAGLSSAVLEGEEETVGTSLSSMAAPCSFSHVRMASSSLLTGPCAVSSVANLRCFTGAAVPSDAPSFTSPFIEFSGFHAHSCCSSMALPASVLDGTCSAVSAASLPGYVHSSANGPRVFLPPLPIHGALPLPQPAARTRLFSVVHGPDEPPSPISLRQLCCLGASPKSPPPPPSAERQSPMRFFKSQGTHTQGWHRHVSGVAGTTGPSLNGAEKGGYKVAEQSSHEQVARVENSSASVLTSAPLGPDTKRSAAASASSGSKIRWGPLGMVQHVREVLGVTASLVRGQLTVLAPSAHADEASRLPPPQQQHPSPSQGLQAFSSSAPIGGESVCRHLPSSAASHFGRHNASVPPAAALFSRRPPGSPLRLSPGAFPHHYSGPVLPGVVSRRSPAPLNSPHYVKPRFSATSQPYTCSGANAATADGGDYSADEEDEECEYGYYDEEGYFHYYEEEDEEGEWYEDDEEDEGENAYFRRCPPPLTHSPPSL
ncbi:hypothetical protein JKF63_02092 [Porcisia hertigi]|uniref:CYC2-like cyclin n=1 Tax=Porcisia hertigi TaxID=2761500 RepID=A0A836HNX6_9TRYP|nr:hypothetical protein JKF63_02092 [Porcisia hertigi]